MHKSWSRKTGGNKLELAEWKTPFTRSLKKRIKDSTHKYINIRSSSVSLKTDIVKRTLDSLRETFIIVLIDKVDS